MTGNECKMLNSRKKAGLMWLDGQIEASISSHQKMVKSFAKLKRKLNDQSTNNQKVVSFMKYLETWDSMELNHKEQLIIFEKTMKSLRSVIASVKTENFGFIAQKLLPLLLIESHNLKLALPMYTSKERIISLMNKTSPVFIEGDMGVGKTTCLPLIVLQLSSPRQKIIHVLSDGMDAMRASSHLNSVVSIGEEAVVGFDIHCQSAVSEETRLVFMTHRSLLHHLALHPELSEFDYVIIDDAHQSDFYVLSLLKVFDVLVKTRPTLKIIVTGRCLENINSNPEWKICIKSFFFEVEVYQSQHTFLDLNSYQKVVIKKLMEILNSKVEGNILIYVLTPGDCFAMVKTLKKESLPGNKFYVQCFHDFIDPNKRPNTNLPNGRIVYVVCDNRCVSRVFPGVKFVIDVGLKERSVHDKALKRKVLKYVPISQDDAADRCRVAGSFPGGVCYRLYNKRNFHDMKKSVVPRDCNFETGRMLLLILFLRFKVAMYESVVDDYASQPKVMELLEKYGWVVDGNLLNGQFIPLLLHFDIRVSSFLIRCINDPTLLLCGVMYFTLTDMIPMHLWGGLASAESFPNFHSIQGDIFNSISIYYAWMNSSDRNKFYYENNIDRDMMEFFHSRVLTVVRTLKHCGVEAVYPSQPLEDKDLKAFKELYVREFSHLTVRSVADHLSSYALDEHTRCFLHPGSVYYYEKEDCKFLLPHSLLWSGGKYLMLHVTHVSDESAGLEDEGPISKLDESYLSKDIGPFGSCVLGKMASKYLEKGKLDAFRSIVGDDLATIKVDRFRGIVSMIYPRDSEETAQIFYEDLTKSLNDIKAEERGEFLVCPLPAPNNTPSPVEVVMGAGAIIHDVINPGEYLDICVEIPSSSGFSSEVLINLLKDYGKILKYRDYSNGDKQGLHITFQNVCVAKAVAENFPLDCESVTVGKPQCEASENTDKAMAQNELGQGAYQLSLSWQWATHCDFALINFTDLGEVDLAYKTLRGSVKIMKTTCTCTVIRSKKNPLSLRVEEIPIGVTFETLTLSLEYAGVPSTKYTPFFPLSRFDLPMEKAFIAGKEELETIVSNVSEGMFIIQAELPKKKSKRFFARLDFNDYEEKLIVENYLRDRVLTTLSQYPIQIVTRNKLRLPKPNLAREIVLAQLERLKQKYHSSLVSISTFRKGDDTFVLVDGEDENSKLRAHIEIHSLVNGEEVVLTQDDKHLLDNPCALKLLAQLGRETNTFVFIDKVRSNLKIFGSPEKIASAREKIGRTVQLIKDEKAEEIDLSGDCFRKGVIKQLIHEYGYDLKKLECPGANSVHFDIKKKKIFVKGTSSAYVEVMKAIQSASDRIRDVSNTSSTGQTCGVCFSDVTRDMYRLQICDHMFCIECINETINYHIREKVVPIVCPYENCNEPVSLDDIWEVTQERDLSSLIVPARNLFIQRNPDTVECPGRDCSGLFKTSLNQKTCFVCGLRLCLQCNSEDHPGLQCNLVRRLMNTDKALLEWLAQNPNQRKLCGQCNAPVEKISGCNHMTCTRCRAHFCWVCLESFRSIDEFNLHPPNCRGTPT